MAMQEKRQEAISIHAPRGGSDAMEQMEEQRRQISIHAPRGGSDSTATRGNISNSRFQSTLPVGGATSPKSN